MQPWQTAVVVILAVAGVAVLFWCMLRTSATADATAPEPPKHRYSGREAPPPLLVEESPGGAFRVMTAWEEAIMPGEVYRRARHGSQPQLAYTHDEHGDLITIGPYGDRVVYRLGGLHPTMRDTYYVVRVA